MIFFWLRYTLYLLHYTLSWQIMLTEVILKLYDSAVDRRDSSIVGWVIPNKVSAFVDVVKLVTLLEWLYRVFQEDCARLRESVPYVKVYRYNRKHLYPKLNGYGDNVQRKVGASCGSKYCNLHSWYVTWQWNVVFTVPAWRFAQSAMLRNRRAFSCIVLVTLRTTMTRVRVSL